MMTMNHGGHEDSTLISEDERKGNMDGKKKKKNLYKKKKKSKGKKTRANGEYQKSRKRQKMGVYVCVGDGTTVWLSTQSQRTTVDSLAGIAI